MNLKEIFESNNSQKKVLLYAREPKASALLFRKYGAHIINECLKVTNYTILSDFPKDTDYYIDLKKYTLKDYTTQDFKIISEALDFENIIKNDRTFRHSLSYYDSCQFIYRTAKFLIEFFKENKFDILVTHTIDCYTVDLVTRIAKYFNIIVISYCGSSFGNKYLTLTERGESNYVRDPCDEEIEEFISFLEDNSSKPSVKSKKQVNLNIAKYYFIYKIKYLWHYLILHKLLGKMEYRYLMTKAQAYPRSINNIIGLKKYFIDNLQDLPLLNKTKTVYLPLHYHPEATTEYWIQNNDYLTYYPSLYKVIKNYTERGYSVLVKEHTAMYMMRDKSLYKELSVSPNVYLLSPYISTYDVLKYAEYTILWTGTTGVEAIMTDKKVILTETETYYTHKKISYIGDEENARIFSKEEKRELARKILGNLLKIR